jgi:hypothetical protein
VIASEAAACISVVVDDRASMDRHLDAAVERMVEVALRQRTHGILVTRHHDRHFTVGLSGTVPFGYTEECDRRA